MYRNYHNFENLSWSDFQLKFENKGGVEFFEWREEFQNAGQIFTPSVKKSSQELIFFCCFNQNIYFKLSNFSIHRYFQIWSSKWANLSLKFAEDQNVFYIFWFAGHDILRLIWRKNSKQLLSDAKTNWSVPAELHRETVKYVPRSQEPRHNSNIIQVHRSAARPREDIP